MARGRKKHTDSWIQGVTILTVIGLIALGALGVYYFMQQRSEQHEESIRYNQKIERKQDRHKKTVYNKPWHKRWIRPITPQRVHSLERQVELPLEIVRNKPGYLRPKNRREYMRDRVGRLDKNIALLKKTQSQEQALKDLERRIKALQMIDTLY